MPWFEKNKTASIVALLTVIAAFLHFYHLNWGAPFYFHPDERNIASAVTQLHYPDRMNPHFFAYGSLPIYTIYFTGVLFNFINHLSPLPSHLSPFEVSFGQAIVVSRFYSAIFATLLIPLLFVIGRRIKDDFTGVFVAFLATASVGFLQFSHFGTFELWLTFFSVVLFWCCLKTIKSKSDLPLLLMAGVFGILLATKVSHLTVLPLPLFAIILQEIRHSTHKSVRKKIARMIQGMVLFIFVTALVYVATNPFVFRSYPEFENSMRYESGVALGTTKVFYTGEFAHSIPVVFQFLHVYPFLLNPLLTVLFIPSFFYILALALKKKNSSYVLLIAFYLLLFLSQAFLYVKWTRYMLPTLPFMFFIIVLSMDALLHKINNRKVSISALTVIAGVSIIFALSYFVTAFIKTDTRYQARDFAISAIPANAPILSEGYDLGITPFNENFHNIQLFNFYEMENSDPESSQEVLRSKLAASEYIIMPSQRIMKVRLQNRKKFPLGNKFYEDLFHEELGFTQIYETPCDIFCNITYLGDPTFRFEETANVFDRPTVYIFKK